MLWLGNVDLQKWMCSGCEQILMIKKKMLMLENMNPIKILIISIQKIIA